MKIPWKFHINAKILINFYVAHSGNNEGWTRFFFFFHHSLLFITVNGAQDDEKKYVVIDMKRIGLFRASHVDILTPLSTHRKSLYVQQIFIMYIR